MKQKILILGISSFSGAATASYLEKKEYKIFGTFSKKKNIHYLPYNKKKIKTYKIDLLKDVSRLINLIKRIRPNIIIDFASICMVSESWLFTKEYFQINVNSKIKLIQGIGKSNFLKKYIYISTPEIFGFKKGKLTEFNSKFDPSTPYASSKLLAELSFKQAFHFQKFPIIISRFSNFYGPGQPIYRLIPKVIMYLKKKIPFSLHGGGKSVRNFIFKDDFCAGVHKLVSKGKIGHTYHFSGEEFIKISKIVKLICHIKNVNYKKLVKNTKDRLGKDSAYQLDCVWTKKKLNWSNKTKLNNGIQKTIKFYDQVFRNLSKESLEFHYK